MVFADLPCLIHTSAINREELREFTSEYYIQSHWHPVVPAADASIAELSQWGRRAFGSPGTSHSIPGGHCRGMSRSPHPGRIVYEDAGNVINENRISHQRILGSLSMPQGISRIISKPRGSAMFLLGDDGRGLGACPSFSHGANCGAPPGQNAASIVSSRSSESQQLISGIESKMATEISAYGILDRLQLRIGPSLVRAEGKIRRAEAESSRILAQNLAGKNCTNCLSRMDEFRRVWKGKYGKQRRRSSVNIVLSMKRSFCPHMFVSAIAER
ncbi:hypothetical protein Tco_0625994 [Tanacetum coccineum]|uniref:Uncharacterized protein n=1 Tax=Tanacetum coccineum TaxID=301880 RepID=A0ABQ4WIF7_9ASTR